ncbi:MAG: site-specific integrase [Halieaceae bacterium]|nr:site-specific integrase [Halieaceae bacterium]
MTPLAPLLEAFFTDRLLRQRRVSPHTVAAYRDTFRLLLRFAQAHLALSPANLQLSHLDASLISAFLDHLETERKNSARARNARLAAIRSFFQYLAFEEPAYSAMIQRVLAIPQKRFERPLVCFLTHDELMALLAAPDQHTWLGRRDHALLLLAVQTGLRVSELTALRRNSVVLDRGAHVRCHGKGRKERCTPLSHQVVRVMRAWLRESNSAPSDPLFPSLRGGAPSRDAVERLVAKYAALAGDNCPSLKSKRVTPHVLRHTTAIQLLQAGVERSVIALWLGHEQIETTQMYLDADLAMKEQALAKTAPPSVTLTRYKPPDALLAFLESL